MSRSVTPALLAKAQGQQSEIVHLLQLAFAADTIRFTSGAHDVSWNGVTWYASNGAMSFEAVTETVDRSGQRLRILLDGVTLTSITALLAQNYVGRIGTLYRAHLDAQGQIVADPFVLFLGYMNSPWEITEDWDNGWCRVQTELVSPLNVLSQVRGITTDPNSHQAVYAGDTFFTHTADKPLGDFGWGPPYKGTGSK